MKMKWYIDRTVTLISTKFRLTVYKLLIEIGRNLKIPKDQKTMCDFQLNINVIFSLNAR